MYSAMIVHNYSLTYVNQRVNYSETMKEFKTITQTPFIAPKKIINMSTRKLNFIRVIFVLIMLFLIGNAIKVIESSYYHGGIVGPMTWTKGSIYYIALISFVVNSIMYLIDQRRRYDYIIVFGFSIIFISNTVFQILGAGLMLLGFIFQFIGFNGKE